LLCGNAMYPFFFPHYAAPLTGVVILMIVAGMRRLGSIYWRGRPAGAVAAGALVIAIAVSSAATVLGSLLAPWSVSASDTARAQVLRQLQARGGRHLVLVRYNPNHNFHYGVVFNDADVDNSPVIWARQTDAAGDRKLAEHFSDRDVWTLNPDEYPILLAHAELPYVNRVVPAAGRRDDPQDGVSPGALAVLLGGNLVPAKGGGRAMLRGVPVCLAEASAELGNVFEPCKPQEDEPAPPYPYELNGISVRFGAMDAPILAAAPDAVTVQVPVGLPPGETTISFRASGVLRQTRVRIRAAAPGLFQLRMRDKRVRGIVQRPDGSLIDLDHPARPGETLRLYATGLGELTPAVRTNQTGEPNLPAQPVHTLIVGVNDSGVPLIRARYAEGMVGVEEITFQIPPDVPAGDNITLSVGLAVGDRTLYSNQSTLPVRAN
jgi:uncharacterized protein (TIGR03437 family)